MPEHDSQSPALKRSRWIQVSHAKSPILSADFFRGIAAADHLFEMVPIRGYVPRHFVPRDEGVHGGVVSLDSAGSVVAVRRVDDYLDGVAA